MSVLSIQIMDSRTRHAKTEEKGVMARMEPVLMSDEGSDDENNDVLIYKKVCDGIVYKYSE